MTLNLKDKYSLPHVLKRKILRKPQKQKRNLALTVILPVGVTLILTLAAIEFNRRVAEDSTKKIDRAVKAFTENTKDALNVFTNQSIKEFNQALTIAKEELTSHINKSANASIERISQSVGIATKKSIEEINAAVSNARKEMVATITGGDSFCYIAFGSLSSSNVAFLTLVQQGQYPLYDISIRIVDLDRVDELRKDKKYSYFDALEKATVHKKVGNLAPSAARWFGEWNLPAKGQARYNIFINARNGFVTELARLKFIDGKWTSAYQVKRELEGKTMLLYEKVDSGYPLNVEGEVDW